MAADNDDENLKEEDQEPPKEKVAGEWDDDPGVLDKRTNGEEIQNIVWQDMLENVETSEGVATQGSQDSLKGSNDSGEVREGGGETRGV